MDGSVSTTASSGPASASSAAPAPSSSPAAPSSPPSSQSTRGPDGKFAAAEPRRRGELKKQIRQGLSPVEAAPAVEVKTETQQDAPQASIETPAKGKPQKAEKAAAEVPAAPQWTEDPTTWAEPAKRAYEGLRQQHQAEIGRWEDVGRKAVEQNRRLLEEVKFLRQQIQQAGVQIDPRDLELLNYRSRDVSSQQMVALQKQRDEYYQQQRQQQEHAQIRQEAQAAVSQMQKLAQSKGIDVRSIYAEYKAAQSVGENIGFEDAASRVMERLEWKQRKVNAAAPAPTVSGVPAGTTLPKSRSRNGRLDRLRALGHAV